MNIVVCVKQVPATQKVDIDPKTGVLLRNGIESKLNPFDLVALEAAKWIADKTDAKIHALSMGPNSAIEVLRESFALGAKEGWLLSDRKFAGADVLATSYALACGIRQIGDVDLIICGKQTTDGDTAQVGPEIAEVLGIPHISWALELIEADAKGLIIKQDLGSMDALVRMEYPCLISVEKTMFQPDLPSYRLYKESKDYPLHILSADDLIDVDMTRIGLDGSPTQVEKIFIPSHDVKATRLEGDPEKISQDLFSILKKNKLIKEVQ